MGASAPNRYIIGGEVLKKLGVNSIIGLIFISFSIFWLTMINGLPEGTKLAAYGPKFFPKIITYGIIIVSIALIIQDFISENKTTKFEYEVADVKKVLLLIALMVAYLFLMPIVGYVVTTIIALFLTLLLFGLKNKKSLILISILFPVLSNILFQTFLKVGLP